MWQVTHVTCHVSCVTCHMSRVTCHMSHVTCRVSRVTCHFFNFFFTIPPPKKILVLWSASVERFGVSRMRDFLIARCLHLDLITSQILSPESSDQLFSCFLQNPRVHKVFRKSNKDWGSGFPLHWVAIYSAEKGKHCTMGLFPLKVGNRNNQEKSGNQQLSLSLVLMSATYHN